MNRNIKKMIFKVERLFLRPFFRNVWLVSDREKKADDNGEVFFEFLQSKPVKAVFAIKKTAPDYERISRIGKVVEYNSLRYKLMLTACDVHLSSHTIHMENHEETPQIALQHGITLSDMHTIYNEATHRNFYLVASGRFEADAFEKTPYTLKPGHVLRTGLPRFDRLVSEPKKLILISLTWRAALNGLSPEEFIKTGYFKEYQKLLLDEELVETANKAGYKLCVMFHPELGGKKSCFKLVEGITEYKGSYSSFFREGNLLITDYSSIASDFAYLYKPVIYFQFDEEEFWKGQLYSKGFYEYETMGLGPIARDYDTFRAEFKKALSADCRIDDVYKKRIDDFFLYHDRNNCERVYNEVCQILKKKNR